MNDPIHCILLNHTTGSNPEQEISEKLKEILEERNTKGIQVAEALQELGIENIKECVIGPNNVAILCEDGGVRRIGFQSRVQHVLPASATTAIAPVTVPSASSTQSSAACAVRNAAKFRRVMLSGLRRGERAGVIIDRGRPLIPASSVPEDLIAQAQVVLQGKSREVIVRELQRTNLNVNEAVNNLLSRDDDDEDGEDNTNEVVLPEELLSLLDPSSHNLLEASDLYSEFDYVHLRDASRKSRDKDRKVKDTNPLPVPATTNREDLNSVVQTWNQDGSAVPSPVKRFVKIVATKKEVVALSECGKIYSWEWSSRFGDDAPNTVANRLLGKETATTIASSALRIATLTDEGKIATWLTETAVGHRASRATEIKTAKLTLIDDETIVELCVSDLLVVVRTSKGFYWCGLYPFNDRPKIWEKERAKSRKHVTFDTTSSEIEEGSEVRTKSCPIYAAGSVALNINGDKATVGVLMESVWTLTEICRFRVFEPLYYDNDTSESVRPELTSAIPGPGESRKRRASSELFTSNPVPREEPWSVSDVIWIHEQSANDCAIVKITDGAYCGIEYVSQVGDNQYASSLSSTLNSKEQIEKIPGKIRLMRKDDLCVVTPKMKSSHSPRNLQKEPLRFSISGNTHRRVLSTVADTSGIRCLIEKRGKLYITRISVAGKILSEHFLPIHAQSIYGSDGALPRLVNYGVDFILFLMDGNGSIIPLARNAARGFKEPVVLNLPSITKSSLCVCLNDMSVGVGISKTWSKKVSLVLLSCPSPAALKAQIPSLLQTILYCDAEGVKYILDKLEELQDETLVEAEALNVRSDGGANIIHAAVRLTLAKRNKEDIDGGTVHGIRLREEETRMAREEAKDLDQKWQRLIRQSRVENSNKEVEQPVVQQVPPPPKNPDSEDVTMAEIDQEKSVAKPVLGVKERQKGALEVVRVLLEHPVLKPIIVQLLSQRDFHGLTPFQAALNSRAFGAAALIWDVIDQTLKDDLTLQKMIFPLGSRPDDSPLFLLCYNDTCSFSWTGEEHINQDIFECRTCGLTGSLCCCTECAFTCHRNHDCKLKKTSPTAYCDCWEKCACKALVAGNQEKREYLLRELLTKTKLHESTNNRGEHVLLFLARTYGRQQSEQSHFSKRKQAVTASNGDSSTPEHDLDPPRFAKFALDVCLSEWNVVISLVNIGMREGSMNDYVVEDTISIMSQNGCSHLDKFTFVLFSKCEESSKLIIDCLLEAAKASKACLVEEIVSRFTRSLVRLFTLCVLVSPTAASVAVRGTIDPGPVNTTEKRGGNLQSLAISGFFSLMKHDYKSHEPKNQAIINFVCRIRSAMQSLAPFALCQVTHAADAILTPVRMGLLKPSILAGLSHSQDPMEVIEKFLSSESDLTSHLSRPEDIKDRTSKRRKTSRRTSEKGNGEPRKEDSDADSESDDDGQSSRRHNSQSGMEESILDISAGTAEPVAPRRKNGISEAMPEEETDETSSESDSDDEEGHVLIDIDDNLDDEETDEATEQAYETSSPRNEQEANATFSIRDQDNDENEEEAPGEVDEESTRNEPGNVTASAPAVPEAPESAEEQPEDQDNARDVLLSETSSAAEQPESREEGNRRRVRRYRISAGGPSPRALMRRQTQFASTSNLDWTRRSFPLEEDFESGVENRVKPESRNKKKADDPHPTTLQTGIQLSTVFSFLVRLVTDFIDCVDDPFEEKCIPALNLKKSLIDKLVVRVEELLEPTWTWLSAALDRMESQLYFGNAILQNSSGEIKPKVNKRKEPVKKEKVVEDPSTAALRRETLSYVMGTIRAQSREAGDDFPTIETENVRILVFVLESYIIFQESVEKYRASSRFARTAGDSALSYAGVQKFFKRSDSLCFPGALFSGAWDTLDSRTSYIPLAEKPYLLVPENEKETLFSPSRGLTTYDATLQNFKTVSTPFVLNMSLSEPMYEVPLTDESDCELRDLRVLEEELRTVDELKEALRIGMANPLNKALSRWKHVMVFMAKECYQLLLDSYGGDPGDSPLLLHVAGFPVKQKMFRSTLEKCRNSQSKDIVIDVNREPLQLIRGTVYQLNKVYVRRSVMFKGRETPRTTLGYPRVKVRFQDEPGEGSGVARSYYTALAEALQSTKVFPFEDFGWEGEEYLFGSPEESPAPAPTASHSARDRSARISAPRNSPATTPRLPCKDTKMHPLSLTSLPYEVEDVNQAEARIAATLLKIKKLDLKKPARYFEFLGQYIFCKVKELQPAAASRITGMILDIPLSAVVNLVNNRDHFYNYVDEAILLLQQSTTPGDLELLPVPDTSRTDNFPLFVKSSKTSNFVIPFPGNLSPMRLNALRNVGRVMGLCLAQGELFPLKLCRHVFKYILDRPINWLDLQFFDLQLFNSLRQVILSNDEDFEPLSLRFLDETTDGVAVKTTSLMVNGEDRPVNKHNVVEYVHRLVNSRLISPENIKCLNALKQGVHDVLPVEALRVLNAEDMRLMICGSDTICLTTLQFRTSFSDESHSSSDTIDKFKDWFWSVFESLSNQEKQDLLFFWTGAPSLPPSSLYPYPTVMIRPPDDLYLPTANTCISRLYVPLYSTRKILKNKLLLAIKAKNFGFV